jgi:ABC-type lipoprotein release transport system permease subunit
VSPWTRSGASLPPPPPQPLQTAAAPPPLLHVDDAARLFRTEGPTGVQLRLRDLHDARRVAGELADRLGPNVVVRDWTRTNRAWFDAVQLGPTNGLTAYYFHIGVSPKASQ